MKAGSSTSPSSLLFVSWLLSALFDPCPPPTSGEGYAPPLNARFGSLQLRYTIHPPPPASSLHHHLLLLPFGVTRHPLLHRSNILLFYYVFMWVTIFHTLFTFFFFRDNINRYVRLGTFLWDMAMKILVFGSRFSFYNASLLAAVSNFFGCRCRCR